MRWEMCSCRMTNWAVFRVVSSLRPGVSTGTLERREGFGRLGALCFSSCPSSPALAMFCLRVGLRGGCSRRGPWRRSSVHTANMHDGVALSASWRRQRVQPSRPSTKGHGANQGNLRRELEPRWLRMMMMMITVQAVFDVTFDSSRMGNVASWVVALTGQCKTLLSCASGSRKGGKPREMRAMRPESSLESIKTKINQVRRGAPDQSRPLKRRRKTEVLAEIETAVTETPRQTLSVLRRHSSVYMSHSTLWRRTRRSPSAVLQARPCTDTDG